MFFFKQISFKKSKMENINEKTAQLASNYKRIKLFIINFLKLYYIFIFNC